MKSSAQTGKLYLVGAGPGDPDLLTIKAARILATCDVVLYDRLVSGHTLRLVRPGAELIYVGKHRGEQDPVQTSIFQQIVKFTQSGKAVVRLKGGDPLIFGRGAEEWLFAMQHGIPVEYVPGISSAIGVPGLAGIPLTHRDLSRSFAVLTGHCGNDGADDWIRQTRADTLVILMGVANRVEIARALLAAGRGPDEPVAFVERGATENQRVITGVLADVAAGTMLVQSPAVWVVGRVAALHGELQSNASLSDPGFF